MEIDLTESSRRRSTRRSGAWIEVTLITGFIFSLLIGMGAVGVLFLSSRGEETSLATPALQTIRTDRIVPQLALAQLAGDSSEALAYQAASAGELDTASAIALTATEISGPQRLSLLLRLGERYLSAGRFAEAAAHFDLARAVAVLDPSVGDAERTAALTHVAEGLLDAGEEAASLDAAVQSMRAAEQTPGLLPAHRSQAYENLRTVAAALDDDAFAQELAELARNPFFEPPGALIAPRLPSRQSAVLFDQETAEAIAQRLLAARQLADRIMLTGGLDIAPETQALAAALIREDQLRNELYRRTLSQGLSLVDQYALLQDRRDWFALKLRIAMQGFGLSLVPEWEQTQGNLLQELGAATANVHLVAEALANELADPVERLMLRTESLLWLAQQAELDLDPGASFDDLDARLQGAQEELARLGSPLALPVALDPDGAPAGFRIQPTR